MKIWLITLKTGQSGFFLGKSPNDCEHDVRVFFSQTVDSLPYEAIVIVGIDETPITPKAVVALAKQYADLECNCWTNDYHGFINGFKAASSLLGVDLGDFEY